MPPADRERVVVWRVGDALLAAPLRDTVEIAPVGSDGRAVSRAGRLEPRTPPGLEPPARPPRAVVLSVAGRVVAMAADEVLGIEPFTSQETAPLPRWLDGLPSGHLGRLIKLPDDQLAALLDVDALPDS